MTWVFIIIDGEGAQKQSAGLDYVDLKGNGSWESIVDTPRFWVGRCTCGPSYHEPGTYEYRIMVRRDLLD